MIEHSRGIEYGKADNLALLMDIARPQGAQNRAAVIIVHGGGWFDGARDDNEVEKEANGLAEAGYVTFAISYRLTSTMAEFNNPYAVGSKYPAAPNDVQAALDHIIEHAADYGVDPSRVCMFGTSAGAHLALLTAYRNPGIKAAAGWSTPIEMKSMYKTSAQQDRVGLFMGGAPAQVGQTTYNEASPLTHVATAPPTLLVQGTQDTTVPQQQARMLKSALKPLQPRSRFVFYPDTHALPQHRSEALNETIAFFNGILAA